MSEATNPIKHDIPKCTCCGHVGPWKTEPLFQGKHILIGVILMLFGFVPGLVYLGTVAIIRSNQKNRAKICTECKAQNMFTFLY